MRGLVAKPIIALGSRATTTSTSGGLVELRDLVCAAADVPGTDVAEVRAGVAEAVASLRETGGAPALILVGSDWAVRSSSSWSQSPAGSHQAR
jgi:hypothetical protein